MRYCLDDVLEWIKRQRREPAAEQILPRARDSLSLSKDEIGLRYETRSVKLSDLPFYRELDDNARFMLAWFGPLYTLCAAGAILFIFFPPENPDSEPIEAVVRVREGVPVQFYAKGRRKTVVCRGGVVSVLGGASLPGPHLTGR